MLDDNARILSTTFNSAKIHEVARIVYVSSSCVFEKSLAYPIRESDLESAPAPSPGYPFSKLLGEAYCRSFRQQYGVPYTIIRPFNVYGPGEMPGSQTGKSHLIPDLTAKLLRGQHPLEIFGDGTHTRSFTHVGDIARGIVSGLESPQPVNEDFNLGHTVEVSILELAKKLWRICGRTDHFASRSVGRHAIDVKKRGLHACDNATQFPV